MPCLTGFISSKSDNINKKLIETMVSTIKYETFYNSGIFHVKELNLYLGWSVHKNSFADCLPIINKKNDIILFIIGEVFFDQSTFQDLEKKGYIFNKNNASYLVHLYEEFKNDFFLKLNGQFIGVLIDKKKQTAFLFNDRFGISRIFTFENKDGFFFSSEAKTILSVITETRDFDLIGISEFLSCECTLGNQSIFKNIKVLPNGTILEFIKNNKYKIKSYFNIKEWENQEILSNENFTNLYIKKFKEIIDRYTSPLGKVGISLTGGLDSRMVVSIAKPPMESIPCYTFGSIQKDSYDVKVAREVAKKIFQKFTIIKVDKKFFHDIITYLKKAIYISDGYIGLAGAVELYANSLARNIAPIRLTGNYGSELLRNVRAFKFNIPRGNILIPDIYKLFDNIKNDFININKNLKNQTFLLYYQAPFQGFGRRSIENSQIEIRTPFLDNDLLKILYQKSDDIDGFKLSKAIVDSQNLDLSKIATDRGYWGTGIPLIRKLKHYYRQATFKLEYFLGRGSPDFIVKMGFLMKFLLIEKMFMYTHKFYDNRLLIRDYFSSFIKELLLSNSNAKFLTFINKKNMYKLISDHFKNKNNYASELDILLSLALTEDIFFNN